MAPSSSISSSISVKHWIVCSLTDWICFPRLKFFLDCRNSFTCSGKLRAMSSTWNSFESVSLPKLHLNINRLFERSFISQILMSLMIGSRLKLARPLVVLGCVCAGPGVDGGVGRDSNALIRSFSAVSSDSSSEILSFCDWLMNACWLMTLLLVLLGRSISSSFFFSLLISRDCSESFCWRRTIVSSQRWWSWL